MKDKIKEGKACYRRTLESRLSQKNIRGVWSGMRKITGLERRVEQVVKRPQ